MRFIAFTGLHSENEIRFIKWIVAQIGHENISLWTINFVLQLATWLVLGEFYWLVITLVGGYQVDHFSKNIFPGCSENRSQILILDLIKPTENCTLSMYIFVEIRKFELFLKIFGLWKIIPTSPEISGHLVALGYWPVKLVQVFRQVFWIPSPVRYIILTPTPF